MVQEEFPDTCKPTMTLKTNITSQILKERKKRIRNAYSHLMNDKVEEAEEDLKWISVSSDILDKLTSKASRWRWSLLIGIFCILVISIGLTFHIPSAGVYIELTTKTVSLNLIKNWQKQEIVTDSFFINNLRHLSAPGVGISVETEEPFDLEVKGKNIHLDKISFSAGSNVTFTVQQEKLEITSDHDSLNGNLNLLAAHIIVPGLDTIIKAAIPETFSFRTSQPSGVPIRLQLSDTSDHKFTGFQVGSISFLEEALPGSGIFESMVEGGKITVLQTGKKIDLQQGDILSLKMKKSRRVNITRENGLLKVQIEGNAYLFEAGPESYAQDLKPTLLEYVYYQQTLAFIWSSALFLWGLLWSIKNSLFR